MTSQQIDPIVVRSRRERREAINALGGIELDTYRTGDGQEVSSTVEPKRDYGAQSRLVPVDKRDHLGLISTTALIVNKIVGTGIFASPKIVLAATGDKGMALMVWLIGCIMTWGGLYIYLEYGMRWPVTGGELYYVDSVLRRPYRLFTYIYASMFILINGAQGNALQFGKEIIVAGSPKNANVNQDLQKLFAVLIITFVCQLQAYSRAIYVRMSNTLAVLKVTSLGFIAVCGLAALAGVRVKGSNEIQTLFGVEDLTSAFKSPSKSPFGYAVALLSVMRAFLRYENANFVLTKVRAGPHGDERQTLRRAVKISVLLTSFLYMMVNFAFFAACTTDEIINAPDTLTLFLQKVFGVSKHAPIAAAVMIAFSAGGAVIALTYANALVKQEIARVGIVPIPEFWSETSHRRTPAHALFLHWIFSVICIAVTPLGSPVGFYFMSVLYSYVHAYICVFLGLGLLCAPWIRAFQFNGHSWKPKSSSLGWGLLAPLIVIYVLCNSLVLIFYWWPGNLEKATGTAHETLPYYIVPVTGLAIIAFGVLWWAWDYYILPLFGYHFSVNEVEEDSQRWRAKIIRVNFHHTFDDNSLAKKVEGCFSPIFRFLWKFVSREPAR